MKAIWPWLREDDSCIAISTSFRFFQDLPQADHLNVQRGQYLDEKGRAKTPSAELVGQGYPLEVDAGAIERLAQLRESQAALSHRAPQVLDERSPRSGFFDRFHQLDALHSSGELYRGLETLAQREQNRYKKTSKMMSRQTFEPNFLKSAGARTLSLETIFRMSDRKAYQTFKEWRWPDTKGEPVCPHCGHDRAYAFKKRPIFKCTACRKTFSVTSGTIFAGRKLKFRTILAAILLFVDGVKGNAALHLSRQIDVQYKTAFVLLHKLRESIQARRKTIFISDGEAETDGVYFGGYVRASNTGREGKKVRPNKVRKKCILTIAKRRGVTIPVLVSSENDIEIRQAVEKHVSTEVRLFTDEHAAYNSLYAKWKVSGVNHRLQYSDGKGTHTNTAEAFHGRVRRSQRGIYHTISGPYLEQYAWELAYRHDRWRTPNGATFHEVLEMALSHPVSRVWKGYWQPKALAL